MLLFVLVFFFFKQKTAYEMRISDWSSDVCSSDLDYFLQVIREVSDDDNGRCTGVAELVLHFARRIERIRVYSNQTGPEGTKECDGKLQGIGQIGRASCRERVCQYV